MDGQGSSADTRPHVMQVIWSLGLGGAEQMVIALARGMDRQQYRVSVCCLNGEGTFAAALAAEGISVVAMHKRPKLDLGLPLRLARLMRRERVAVVQTHLWSSNFWGRLAAALAGVPVVIVTEHGIERWRGGWHRLADRWLRWGTSRVVFVSDVTRRREVVRARLLMERTEAIPNGIDSQRYRPASAEERRTSRERLGIGDDERVALFVGRLVPEKGLEHLLEALIGVVGVVKRFRLVLVGDGPLKEELQQSAARWRVYQYVRFAGFWPEMADWYVAADCLVLSSVSEAFPMTVLEAMASGVPVIATAVGDVPQMLGRSESVHSPQSTVHRNTQEVSAVDHGPSTVDVSPLRYEVAACGLIVPPGNALALSRAMERLLTDRELAERLGAAGRARVLERYTDRQMVERYAQLYDSLLSEKTGRGA
jgi:glycosyltransferase involved in cell wall biosynthesis